MTRDEELDSAAMRGESPYVSAALKAGANPNRLGLCGNTPLTEAASRGYKNICAMLLGYNADVDCKIGGEPALIAATRLQYIDVVKMLLNHGADTFVTDQHGKRAMDYLTVGFADRLEELSGLLNARHETLTAERAEKAKAEQRAQLMAEICDEDALVLKKRLPVTAPLKLRKP